MESGDQGPSNYREPAPANAVKTRQAGDYLCPNEGQRPTDPAPSLPVIEKIPGWSRGIGGAEVQAEHKEIMEKLTVGIFP